MSFNLLKIKELLKKEKITQKVFANEIDVTTQTVINYFNGRSKIDVYTLEKIANSLGVSVGYFFDEEVSNVVNEPPVTYKKRPKYLEQRVEELEKKFMYIEKQINKNQK